MNSMSHSAIRPPWLPTPDCLETMLSSSELQISLYSLCDDRTSCPMVERLLSNIVQNIPRENGTPTQFEEKLARAHLAADFQRILVRWCNEGLNKTLQTDIGKALSGSSPGRGELEVRTGRPVGDANIERAAIPLKRPSEDEGEFSLITNKMARMSDVGVGEKDFRCPYNQRDPTQHTECVGKRFPNPRKLKEHIWRFTKPFKCPTCGEGFGREKTKAIHCDQRKVKCTEQDTEYDGSPEQQRDRLIERAKNTQEILEIFDDYERKYPSASSMHQSTLSPDTFSRIDSPDEGSWSQPASPYDTKSNAMWTAQQQSQRFIDTRQVPLTIPFSTPDSKNTYPSPPGEQNIQTPVSPLETHMSDFPQHTAASPTAYSSHHGSFSQMGGVQFNDATLFPTSHQSTPMLGLEIPKIVISQEELMSPARHGYHSPIYPSPGHQMGSPTIETDDQLQQNQSMPRFGYDQPQGPLLSQQSPDDGSVTMYSDGWGSIPAFSFRARMKK